MNHDLTGPAAAHDSAGLADGVTIGCENSSRRAFLITVAQLASVIVATPLLASRLRAETLSASEEPITSAAISVMVYKDPGCGCCKEWVKHMQKAGFTVTAQDTTNMDAMKIKLGVPGAMASCHTAIVGNYLVEGHVPADVVQKLLKETPNARGIAVPGMPQGSPGMEGPTKDKYNVMLFDRLGKATVYAYR